MKKVWIFFPKMTLPDVPKIRFSGFLLEFFPKMALAQFPVFGFFFQDSRIGVKVGCVFPMVIWGSIVTMSAGKTRPTLSKMSPNEFVILAYELLNRQPGLIIEKILIYLENNINSSMRKILGVEGDTDYDKLSLDVICEAKERL